MYKIKTIGERVLYVAEDAPDLRTALEEAVESGAELQGVDFQGVDFQGGNFSGANFQCANFSGANFQCADLSGVEFQYADLQGVQFQYADLQGVQFQGADLSRAEFQYAELHYAEFQGAILSGAELQGADLTGAITPSHALWAFRNDLWSILDSAPVEAAGLLSALSAGDVDGSTYEGPCACLVGTLERVARALKRTIDVPHRADRPAEMWFAPIRSGDVPVWLPAEEEISEGVFRASWALRWIEEWFEQSDRKPLLKEQG